VSSGGEAVDRDAWGKKFPSHAADLDQNLDVLNVLDQFAGGLPQLKSPGDPVSPVAVMPLSSHVPATGNLTWQASVEFSPNGNWR